MAQAWMLSPLPVVMRFIALAFACDVAARAARHGAANTLLHRGEPSTFRAAQSQGRGQSSRPIGMSMARIATSLGRLCNNDLRSTTSTSVFRVRSEERRVGKE